MFETITQVIPHFEAKGIEVVRRDQCPAVVKMQEKALRVLFETLDMSRVKAYIVNEWSKMMQGGDKLLLRDFIFSKEVMYTICCFYAHVDVFEIDLFHPMCIANI